MFNIIKNLYTRKDYDWIRELDDNVPSLVIFNYLLSDPSVGRKIKSLAPSLFSIPPKNFIAVLHTYVPKQNRAPFLGGVRKKEEDKVVDEIMDKLRRYFKYSEKEFSYIQKYIFDNFVKDNIKEWQIKLGLGGKRHVVK